MFIKIAIWPNNAVIPARVTGRMRISFSIRHMYSYIRDVKLSGDLVNKKSMIFFHSQKDWIKVSLTNLFTDDLIMNIILLKKYILQLLIPLTWHALGMPHVLKYSAKCVFGGGRKGKVVSTLKPWSINFGRT